jgi:hypothetical protein
VEISVEDSGIGIKPEFLAFVFDRFRQADASTTRRHGGLGLGLAIVKHLVELHGGNVRVKSPGEGQGSTFIIALPVSHVRPNRTSGQESRQGDPLAALELPRLDGVRVLIVDDEPDGAAMLARILEDRGARPACASGGAEALRMLASEPFDVLLSDVGMPEIDGYGLIRRLRQSASPNQRVTAVAVTAYARAEDRQRALLAGYQMHVSKPVEVSELIAGIASLLHLPR